MNINIKQAKLTFKREHTHRAKTKRFLVHHSASPAATTTILDIQRWHHEKGWYGIGYQFVIYPNGDIYQGRPEWAVGAHAWQDTQHEANSDGIGICLIGNFMTEKPTEAQLKSLVLLINYLKGLYGDLPTIGHKDVMATSCPGTNFPWEWLHTELDRTKKKVEGVKEVPDWMKKIMEDAKRNGLIMPSADHKPEDTATKWFVLSVGLNILKIMGRLK